MTKKERRRKREERVRKRMREIIYKVAPEGISFIASLALGKTFEEKNLKETLKRSKFNFNIFVIEQSKKKKHKKKKLKKSTHQIRST